METKTVISSSSERKAAEKPMNVKSESATLILLFGFGSMVLAVVVFFLSLGIEITSLWVLKTIHISFLAIPVALVGTLVLVAPLPMIIAYGVEGVANDLADGVSWWHIAVDILLAILLVALWAFAAWKLAIWAYDYLNHLEEIGRIAFPDGIL